MTEQDVRDINALLARFYDKRDILGLNWDSRFEIERELLRRFNLKVDKPLDPTPNCPPGGSNVALRIAA